MTFYAFLGHWRFKAFKFEHVALALDVKGVFFWDTLYDSQSNEYLL